MNKHQENPTTVASYTQAFASALEIAGVEPQRVFSEVGISPQLTSDPLKRISNADVSRLFQASVRATANPYFGIAVGKCMQPGNLHALGFAMLASVSLRDFYNRICNYYRVVSQNAEFLQEEIDGASVLIARNPSPSVCDETQDVWVTMMVRFIRFLNQQELNPLWITLRRSEPAGGGQPFLDYFKCPVHFNSGDLSIAIDSRFMDRTLPGGSADLAQQHDQIVMQYLQKLDSRDIVNRVRGLIIEELASGTLSKQGVAEKMHMSARNLQLKLAEKKHHFPVHPGRYPPDTRRRLY